MQQLIILTTMAYCCRTVVHGAAQYPIFLAVTTEFCLLPTPMVSFSIYSLPKCVCVCMCDFVRVHVVSVPGCLCLSMYELALTLCV